MELNNNNNVVIPNAPNAPNAPQQPRRNLGFYTIPNPTFYDSGIVVPPVNANNFGLKPQLITLMQQNC
ncbi:hypothetical protein AHAS_Ahas03G0149500 [Arachis hypogaea]